MEILRSSNEARLAVWFSTAISTRMPPHTHEAFEWNLVVAGALRYRFAEALVDVSAGECILLPPGVIHELVHASPDAAFWVLEGRGARVVVDDEPDAVSTPRVVPLGHEGVRELGRLARGLWLRPGPEETESLTSELEARSSSLHTREASPRAGHPGVRRARARAEAVEKDALDVTELARVAGVSPSRLAHLFQDEVGVSPLQYLNYCRVQAFVRRWDGEQRNLLAAALAAGFGSYAQFHRVFWQVCGSAPRDHRRFLSQREIDPARQLGTTPNLERLALAGGERVGAPRDRAERGATERDLIARSARTDGRAAPAIGPSPAGSFPMSRSPF